MAHKNYSKFAKRFSKKSENFDNKKMIENNNQIVDQVHENIINEIVDDANCIGVVTGCDKLRVRMQPTIGSSVICVLNAGTEVTINNTLATTNEFYPISLPNSNTIGYCMKKFISIK